MGVYLSFTVLNRVLEPFTTSFIVEHIINKQNPIQRLLEYQRGSSNNEGTSNRTVEN